MAETSGPSTEAAKKRLINALRKAHETHEKAVAAEQRTADAVTAAVVACRVGGVPWYPIAAVLGIRETHAVAKYKPRLPPPASEKKPRARKRAGA